MQHAAGCTQEFFFAHPEHQVSPDARRRFLRILKKREGGTPLAYITGRKEFWSLSFLVNRNTLIPRPETEILVESALLHIEQGRNVPLLEIGTGSGNIAASIALERPRSRITATDISRRALRTAGRNLKALGLANVSLLHGPLFIPIQRYMPGEKFELILSNPPYVTPVEWSGLPEGIREHEPRHALVAGPTGLEKIAGIIEGAPGCIRTGGWLLLEIGFGQKEAVLSLFSGCWDSVSCHQDLNGIPRVVEARFVGE